MSRTRLELGRREDLGGDCANCFGLCCVAVSYTHLDVYKRQAQTETVRAISAEVFAAAELKAGS